ncbi:uncharacterized protein LOC62_04G005588 [Vanrija pseudolonga]|uniref:Uncharacterized protein n=1 Tax=Vanrija pseudolonga TaxID=143232 RepID=A0AAF0YC79_9TREE|nr:hypothetical protein LOC62_04G005588 [Vanrija pseudolonga]
MIKFVKALLAGLRGGHSAQALAERAVRETKPTMTAQVFRSPPAASTTTPKQWGWTEIDTLGHLMTDFTDMSPAEPDHDMFDNFGQEWNNDDPSDDFGIFYDNGWGFYSDVLTEDDNNDYPTDSDTDESTSGTSSFGSSATGTSTSTSTSATTTSGGRSDVPVTLASLGAVNSAFEEWGMNFPKPEIVSLVPEAVDEFVGLFVERSAHWPMDNVDSGDEGGDEDDDQDSFSLAIPTQPFDEDMVTRDLGLGLWDVPSV